MYFYRTSTFFISKQKPIALFKNRIFSSSCILHSMWREDLSGFPESMFMRFKRKFVYIHVILLCRLSPFLFPLTSLILFSGRKSNKSALKILACCILFQFHVVLMCSVTKLSVVVMSLHFDLMILEVFFNFNDFMIYLCNLTVKFVVVLFFLLR